MADAPADDRLIIPIAHGPWAWRRPWHLPLTQLAPLAAALVLLTLANGHAPTLPRLGAAIAATGAAGLLLVLLQARVGNDTVSFAAGLATGAAPLIAFGETGADAIGPWWLIAAVAPGVLWGFWVVSVCERWGTLLVVDAHGVRIERLARTIHLRRIAPLGVIDSGQQPRPGLRSLVSPTLTGSAERTVALVLPPEISLALEALDGPTFDLLDPRLAEAGVTPGAPAPGISLHADQTGDQVATRGLATTMDAAVQGSAVPAIGPLAAQASARALEAAFVDAVPESVPSTMPAAVATVVDASATAAPDQRRRHPLAGRYATSEAWWGLAAAGLVLATGGATSVARGLAEAGAVATLEASATLTSAAVIVVACGGLSLPILAVVAHLRRWTWAAASRTRREPTPFLAGAIAGLTAAAMSIVLRAADAAVAHPESLRRGAIALGLGGFPLALGLRGLTLHQRIRFGPPPQLLAAWPLSTVACDVRTVSDLHRPGGVERYSWAGGSRDATVRLRIDGVEASIARRLRDQGAATLLQQDPLDARRGSVLLDLAAVPDEVIADAVAVGVGLVMAPSVEAGGAAARRRHHARTIRVTPRSERAPFLSATIGIAIGVASGGFVAYAVLIA